MVSHARNHARTCEGCDSARILVFASHDGHADKLATVSGNGRDTKLRLCEASVMLINAT